MSTKINNGMIAVDTNPFVAQARINAILKPVFLAKFDEAAARFSTNIAAFVDASENADRPTWVQLDRLLFPTSSRSFTRWNVAVPVHDHTIREELYALVEDLRITPTHTFSALDFGYEVVMLPNGRGLNAQPLVLVFSEDPDYREVLLAAGVTRDYGYWDNTDRDDDVTEAEWQERKLAWSKLDLPRDDGLISLQPSKFDATFPGYRREGAPDVASEAGGAGTAVPTVSTPEPPIEERDSYAQGLPARDAEVGGTSRWFTPDGLVVADPITRAPGVYFYTSGREDRPRAALVDPVRVAAALLAADHALRHHAR